MNIKRCATLIGTVAAAVAVSAVVLHAGAAGAAGASEPVRPAGASAPADAVDGRVAGPNAPIRRLDEAGSARALNLAPATNAIGAVTTTPTSSMPAYLEASLAEVTAVWSRKFSEWGYPAPTVTTHLPAPGETLATACGENKNAETFEYCSTDDSITLGQTTATNLWNGTINGLTVASHGDMSVTLYVAHEYGHNLENELGLWKGVSAANLERGADCFAGVWAADAAARGILDADDLTEGYSALDLWAEHPEAGISDNVHGLPKDRTDAFALGLADGARSCATTYLGAL